MKAKNQNPDYTRENFAMTSEEVPFFPLRPVNKTNGEMDGVEQAQFDFVQQAGQPERLPDDKTK